MSVTQNGKVEVTVRLTGDDSASAVIQKVNDTLSRAVASANGKTQASGGIVAALGERWHGVADAAGSALAKFGLVSAGISAIRGIVDAVGDMVVEGAKAADQYDILASQLAGLDVLIESTKRASGGMFSQREIVSAISTFQSFGLELGNIDQVMAEVAKTSIRTGEDAGFLLESITKGVARLSPAILDNLQLQVSLSQINELATATTGKATAELSKQEQQAAALNLVLGELKKTNSGVQIEEMRISRIKRLENAFEDLWTSIKTGFADVAVGLYDFFDKTAFGASEAERKIARMADTFPRVLSRMRGAAESELPTIQRLFDALQREAEETNRLIGTVTTAAGEVDDLQRAIATSQQSEQIRFESRRSIIEANVKANVLTEEQGAARIATIEAERDKAIEDRLVLDRRRWKEEVDRRRAAEAAIKGIDEDAAKRVEDFDARARARAFGIPQIIDESTKQIEKIEADLESARARRDVGAVKRLQEQRVQLKGYIQDLRDAEKADKRGAGGAGGASTNAAPYQLPHIRAPRSPRVGKVRARASESDPFADLQARLQNTEAQAQAVIDGLREYQVRLNQQVIEKGDQLNVAQLQQINDRWDAAQERVLDTEHALAEARLDIAFDTEQRITQITEDEEEKRKQIEAARVALAWDNAQGMIAATNKLGETFLKSEKARAAWNAGMAVLDASLAFIRSGGTRWDLLAMGAVTAAGYAAKGGGGGGGTRGIGRQPSQTVSASSFDKAAAGVTINNNWNAPFYSTPGEFAAHLRGIQRAGGAAGVPSGGVV